MKHYTIQSSFIYVVLIVLFGVTACAGIPSNPQEDRSTSQPYLVFEFHDTLAPGETAPSMVLIQAGQYAMGDHQGIGRNDEYPVHDVSVNAFALGKYEVTVAEFRRFVKETNYQTEAEKGGGCHVYSSMLQPGGEWKEDNDWQDPHFSQQDNHPVVCVSWNDALAYTKWLSDKTGQRYRLPTEAEWEYAARAGSDTNYFWGNFGSCDQANCCKTGITWMTKQTLAVGTHTDNAFGLHDIHGNVWEWTASAYTNTYTGKEQLSASSDNYSERRTARGGSWLDLIHFTRSSRRIAYWPQERYSSTGFRVARDVSQELVNNATKQLTQKKTTLSQLSP